MAMNTLIHEAQPTLQLGPDIDEAARVAILLHGRGSSADAMAPLAEAVDPGEATFLIPQAAQNRWYPNSAFAPLATNEPDLSSALAAIDAIVAELREQGVSDDQLFFGGFSQGACLAAEYVARNARPYGGLFVLSGALIGPPGTPRDYPGSLTGMPVFIGGSDVDPWVAHDLIVETADVLRRLGADVDFRTYPGMGHAVNADELDAVRQLLANGRSK
jgi:predicted esterase